MPTVCGMLVLFYYHYCGIGKFSICNASSTSFHYYVCLTISVTVHEHSSVIQLPHQQGIEYKDSERANVLIKRLIARIIIKFGIVANCVYQV